MAFILLVGSNACSDSGRLKTNAPISHSSEWPLMQL